jgi:hypothetical protein
MEASNLYEAGALTSSQFPAPVPSSHVLVCSAKCRIPSFERYSRGISSREKIKTVRQQLRTRRKELLEKENF